MTNYKEILRYYVAGYSRRKIAESLGYARNTVDLCISRAEEKNLPLPVSEETTNEELFLALYSTPKRESISEYLMGYSMFVVG